MKRAILITGLTALALAGTAVTATAFGKEHMRGHGGPQINFEDVDTDADGKVTAEEMQAHFKARFDAADTDKDGALSVEEMAARAEAERAERMAKGMARMIENRDTNKDGKLSLEEMQPKQQDQMFTRMDTDKDGALSAEEFAQMGQGRHGEGDKDGRWMRHDHGEGRMGEGGMMGRMGGGDCDGPMKPKQ